MVLMRDAAEALRLPIEAERGGACLCRWQRDAPPPFRFRVYRWREPASAMTTEERTCTVAAYQGLGLRVLADIDVPGDVATELLRPRGRLRQEAALAWVRWLNSRE